MKEFLIDQKKKIQEILILLDQRRTMKAKAILRDLNVLISEKLEETLG